MSEQPFPLQKPNDMPLETYLLHLLAAIVKQNGGEMRLTTSAILNSVGCAITRHPSDKNDAVVLRVTPRGTDTYFVKEAPAWTAPTSPKTRVLPNISQPRVETQHHESVPKTTRSRQLDDMALYLMEQEQQERAADRQNNQQAQDLRETGVFPWRTDSER